MKKLIFICECAIFGFILFQIVSLAAFSNKDDDPHAEALQKMTIAAYEPTARDEDPLETFMNVSEKEGILLYDSDTPLNGDIENTLSKAQLEAMRIVQDGDIDSYLEEVDKSPIAKMLLGL